jgi:hypothetical protein
MDNAVNLNQQGGPATQGYSTAVRSILAFTALAVTLMPVPITYLKIIPTYQKHAWFLIFYAPFLCLLTLCYLFYVRDSLARTIFADVLDPPAPPDPYYRESFGDQLKRGFRRLKGALLGILPAVLVLISMYCVSRYFAAFDRSVGVSIDTYGASAAGRDTTVGMTDRRASLGSRGPGTREPGSKGPAKRSRAQVQTPPADTARDSLPLSSDSSAVRNYVLRTSEIDDIPRLAELTVLYVGAFVALLVAVALMALKEYAKEALGLSEHELMFGRYRRSVAEE